MEIKIDDYTYSEIAIIIDKMDNLSINYERLKNFIKILDNIDMKTYQYLIDFSR